MEREELSERGSGEPGERAVSHNLSLANVLRPVFIARFH